MSEREGVEGTGIRAFQFTCCLVYSLGGGGLYVRGFVVRVFRLLADLEFLFSRCNLFWGVVIVF